MYKLKIMEYQKLIQKLKLNYPVRIKHTTVNSDLKESLHTKK